MRAKNLSQLLGLFSCFVGLVASFPLEQINSNKQTTLFRRAPMHGIFHGNVVRNRVDIGVKAKGRSNDAGKLLRQGNVGKAIGHYVSGAIGQHPIMQGAIARGRVLVKLMLLKLPFHRQNVKDYDFAYRNLDSNIYVCLCFILFMTICFLSFCLSQQSITSISSSSSIINVTIRKVIFDYKRCCAHNLAV